MKTPLLRFRVFKKHKIESNFKEVGAVFGDGVTPGQTRRGLIWSALNQFNICVNEDYKLEEVC